MGKYIWIVIVWRERERESSSPKSKIIIWALFDDAESSYKNAVKKYYKNFNNIEVHSIGINDISFKDKERFFYHKIDLSIQNFNLINELKKLPKPDIILASPPCESWSGADCNGKMLRSISNDCHWVVMNKKYYDEYNKTCHPVKHRFFEQKERGRLIGEGTISGTILIIQIFKPKVWVIENPKTSKSWEYQRNHWNFEGNENSTYYSSYDNRFSLKPTIFKSNIKLDLLKKRQKGNNDHMARGSYSLRSSIPTQLVADILNQIFKHLNIEISAKWEEKYE
ncbi:cytosine methyltransferase [Metamycoplasma hominis]|uniref:cytosine methyltransferase n=1 Tax=Metamycoplasma hominis TaxID=2098 RepID=UPI003CE7FCBE